MSYKDVLRMNAKIYTDVGKALNDHTKRESRTVFIGGPQNLNAMVACAYAKEMNPDYFTSLARINLERALSYIASRTGHKASQVKKVAVWGNSSTSMYVDTRRTTI